MALAVLAALALTPGCNRQTQHSPDVWAVVNGKEIKKDEVEKYYRTRINPEGQSPSQEEGLSLKLNVLDELINNEILIERAKKLNLEASDGEVEDKFTELKSPYTEDEFQRQLKDRGVSVDDLKRDLAVPTRKAALRSAFQARTAWREFPVGVDEGADPARSQRGPEHSDVSRNQRAHSARGRRTR